MFKGTYVSEYMREVICREREFGVSLNGKEMAGCFDLIKSSVQKIIGFPFTVGCHKEILGINFKYASENKFRDFVI